MIRIIQKSVIILISFTFLVSTFSFTPTRAKADETKDTNTKNVQETSSENEMIVKVNGKEVHLLWPVLKVGAQIMVAAPDLAYALGAEFKYYPGNQKVGFSKNKKKVQLQIKDIEKAEQAGVLLTQEGVLYVSLSRVASGLGDIVSRQNNEISISLQTSKTSTTQRTYTLFSSLEEMLPKGSTLFKPDNVFVNGNNSAQENTDNQENTIAYADFNGDGELEGIICYTTPAGKSGVIIYQEDGIQYKKLGQSEDDFIINGLEIDELDNQPGDELMLLWKAGNFGNFMRIYALESDGLRIIHDTPCDKVETGDFNEDEINELAIWHKDAGNGYAIQVYQWSENASAFTLLSNCPAYYEKIASYYEEQLKNDASNRSLLYYYADACIKAGDAKTALEQSGRGTNAILGYGYPPEQYFYRIKGDAYYLQDSFANAIGAYQKALEITTAEPEQLQARYHMAVCHYELKQTQEAQKQITQALNQGSDWAEFSKAMETYAVWQNDSQKEVDDNE